MATASVQPGPDHCAVFVRNLPVTGAAVSTIGYLAPPETLCASDAAAARLDQLQFDLREGPCWDATGLLRPIIEPDFRGAARWPLLRDALGDTPVGAVYAFPLMLGPVSVGVVDLYSEGTGTLSTGEQQRAAELAQVTGAQVLTQLLQRGALDVDTERQGSALANRHIHQATGMVVAQLGVSPADAELVIRAHAFARGLSVSEVADDILAWRLDFSADAREGGDS